MKKTMKAVTLGLLAISFVWALGLQAQAQTVPTTPPAPANFYGHRWLLGGDANNQKASWVALHWQSTDRYEIQRSVQGKGVWKTLPSQGWEFYADVLHGNELFMYRIRAVRNGQVSEWVYTPLL